jgi:Ran GTPase-activating protein (RanGAP) involved in mRNA processing and transport
MTTCITNGKITTLNVSDFGKLSETETDNLIEALIKRGIIIEKLVIVGELNFSAVFTASKLLLKLPVQHLELIPQTTHAMQAEDERSASYDDVLFKMIKHNKTLTAFTLQGDAYSKEFMRALCELLGQHQTITAVAFADMRLTESSAKHISYLIHSTKSLKKIGLNHLIVDPSAQDVEFVIIMQSLLHNTSLHTLELRQNVLNINKARALCQLINANLTNLKIIDLANTIDAGQTLDDGRNIWDLILACLKNGKNCMLEDLKCDPRYQKQVKNTVKCNFLDW